MHYFVVRYTQLSWWTNLVFRASHWDWLLYSTKPYNTVHYHYCILISNFTDQWEICMIYYFCTLVRHKTTLSSSGTNLMGTFDRHQMCLGHILLAWVYCVWIKFASDIKHFFFQWSCALSNIAAILNRYIMRCLVFYIHCFELILNGTIYLLVRHGVLEYQNRICPISIELKQLGNIFLNRFWKVYHGAFMFLSAAGRLFQSKWGLIDVKQFNE